MQGSDALPAWYVISLRPTGGHDGLRRAARRHGAGLIALSPWCLRSLDTPATRAALQTALQASHVVFTSPAAVRAAHALQPLRQQDDHAWLAVGAGTAAALRRAGVVRVHAPTRMDSEGLLALPDLQQVDGATVGLVTAPGGRGTLAPALQSRGARIVRADVYRREPVAASRRAIRSLRTLAVPAMLALSSGEALTRTLDQLPEDAADALRGCVVAAASRRLATVANARGFDNVVLAAGPRPRQLLEAGVQALYPNRARRL